MSELMVLPVRALRQPMHNLTDEEAVGRFAYDLLGNG